MNVWRRPWAQVVLVAVTAVAVAVFLATIPTFRHFFDLGVYRGAVRSWLIDGDGLYDYRYQDTEYGFTYPPFAALVMSPLAITSWPVAVAAAALLNAAAVVVLIRWYFVPILRRRGWPVWTPCALMFLGFLVFEPSRDTFSYGQVNLLLLVLVVLPDGFAADGERVLLAVLGALIGIAAFLVIRLAVAPPAALRPAWARR